MFNSEMGKDLAVATFKQQHESDATDVSSVNKESGVLSAPSLTETKTMKGRCSEDGRASDGLIGLILEPSNLEQGQYRRVGSVRIDYWYPKEAPTKDPALIIADAIKTSALSPQRILETSKSDPHVHRIELI